MMGGREGVKTAGGGGGGGGEKMSQLMESEKNSVVIFGIVCFISVNVCVVNSPLGKEGDPEYKNGSRVSRQGGSVNHDTGRQESSSNMVEFLGREMNRRKDHDGDDERESRRDGELQRLWQTDSQTEREKMRVFF